MKIAVVQMLYPQGHRVLDKEYVKILSQENEIIIVDNGEYFSDEFCDSEHIIRIKVSPLSSKRCEALKRFLHYVNLTIILFRLRQYIKDIDILLFLNIHNSLYNYVRWLPNVKKVVFHHQDVDDMLTYPKYFRWFNEVKNQFVHICLADFIKDGLIKETGVDQTNVFTVYQPLVFNYDRFSLVPKEKLLIGIGRSMEEVVVDRFIELDKQTDCSDCNNKLVLRSKKTVYKGKKLEVINGFLSREEYESYYERASISVVIYPSRYKYRYSGIIDDSLAHNLVVLTNKTLCSNYFANKYKTNVMVFNSIEDLWNKINSELPSPSETDRELFFSNHSKQNVHEQLREAIKF